ncbi:uncharacterized protein LOC116286577 isoform X2 [Actinia tenebrosa]|uniref:Uncharacterized protein LOC116286577 isoform X2 n=1 Tax=Actinia tenebrosa TaxID=6105 RepID=A0A6P8GZS8_ACTTE|nr:uncharacterized protein LOC116286577 isoform X2 [Actinia tenebrosa]
MVDKQIENIEQAQNKAADFLNKEIKLDITPEKGWHTEDMFIPPGYHLKAEVKTERKSSNSPEEHKQAYKYPKGMGSVMMNGCWGTGYEKSDPCFDALEANDQCRNMIDGAAFIGVGFDGRGQYSPESRKMSIIQRSCAGKASYDDFQVPDTMNVHGIYDTKAQMTVFTSRSEYQMYLQKEAGVSGSLFGFYAGVKSAWGSSESGAQQTNLAVFDIDVDRYEIFQDEVKPQDLSRSFLREFISLPNSYFASGAPAKFQEFILRWGTHYIKSARFGGQLEVRKTQLASMSASKEEFAEKSEVEFKSLFWSAGSRSRTESGSSSKSQQNYMSTSVVVQGGSQRIAAIVSDMYSPTFKSEFTVDEKSQKSYYLLDEKRVYCEFASREEMEFSLKRKRVSLKRAIEVYMEEGARSISDVSIPAGKAGCESNDPKYQSATKRPSWKEMTAQNKPFIVIFDMLNDLKGVDKDGIDIPKSMSRTVQYRGDQWHTSDRNGEFHMYDGFSNGLSFNPANKKISIFGLVLKYNESKGTLVLGKADYDHSKNYFPNLSPLLKGKQLARAEWPIQEVYLNRENSKNRMGHLPCNVKWSNGLRFDPSDRGGKCLHFTASSKSTLYAVFSAVPSNKDSWYYVEISSSGVGIYKAQRLMVTTVNTNAIALGDAILYQSYFVCVTESPTSTVIEYGKTQGTTNSGDVYLTLIDHNQPIHARFYSFGNGEEAAQIVDSHVVSRKLTATDCKGDTYRDKDEPNCVQRCHEACAPLAGCQYTSKGEPRATDCNEFRYAKKRDGTCVSKCRPGELPNKDQYCTVSYDLSFKSDTKPDHSKMKGFPTLNHFTLCLWLRLPNNTSSARIYEYEIMKYFNKGSEEPLFYVEINKLDGEVRFAIGVTTTAAERSRTAKRASLRSTKIDKVNKWHHICVYRDSIYGETHIYRDGFNPFPGPNDALIEPNRVPQANGELQLGGFGRQTFPGAITNLNIWDRKLTDNEIAKMALSCDAGNSGNVKNWGDISTELNLDHYIVKKSSCITEQ